MTASLRLFELETRSPQHNRSLILNVIPDYIQKPQLPRLTACDCDHIYAESTFKIGVLE